MLSMKILIDSHTIIDRQKKVGDFNGDKYFSPPPELFSAHLDLLDTREIQLIFNDNYFISFSEF